MTPLSYNNQLLEIESLLFGFAMKLTKNKENAKDLMQETLMRSYGSKDRYVEGTNFKAWMTTIMFNSHINHYRKAKNRVVKPIENFIAMLENRSVEGNVHSIILMKDLRGMIDNLKDDYKIPFNMFFQGYHYDEIAETVNLPMGTVKSRIFYARKKLQAKVNNKYGGIENLMAVDS